MELSGETHKYSLGEITSADEERFVGNAQDATATSDSKNKSIPIIWTMMLQQVGIARQRIGNDIHKSHT